MWDLSLQSVDRSVQPSNCVPDVILNAENNAQSPWQRKRNYLENIWMLIGCLSAMLSFGTCHGNRGGFTVCAVKNNLGILVVEFIPKRIRFELPFLCCGGHFRKQMYSLCMCFQDYYHARRRKNVSSVAVLTHYLELPRSNRKREYTARTVRLIVSYCSNGKR